MVVLIVDKDQSEAQKLSSIIRKCGHVPTVTDNARTALQIIRRESPGLVLYGLNGQAAQLIEFFESSQALESQPPVIVMSQKASMEDAISTMKQGAQDFWVRPISLDRIEMTLDWLESKNGSVNFQTEASVSSNSSIISQNSAMAHLKAIAKRVASSNATVFLQGESGTGKELFARYIHSNSPRRTKRFVAINCAALPESLMESELFGHEKGAFTGAIRAKEGKFELAQSGTIFLDEITEIPIYLQSKLLRVLQEGEVDRVGGKYPIPVDARVIASTNVTIDEALKSGQFRRDLYYRLNVIPLKIPPLRDRTDDIPLLCRYFVAKYNQHHGCSIEGISPDAMKSLSAYHWPGNVRELENVIQRAMLLCQHTEVTPEHLIFDHESGSHDGAELELMPISEMERRLIQKALATVSGNRTRAAEILGISVRTLRNKLHEYRSIEDPSE